MSGKENRNQLYDPWLVLYASTIISIGLVMVASASIPIAERFHVSPLFFTVRQILGLGLGVLCFIVMTFIPTRLWSMLSGPLLMCGILFLIILLIPGLSREVNGSTRWIFLGPISIQVSEFVKLSVVLYISSYLTRRHIEVTTQISGFLKPLLVIGVISCLLLLEPDFGAAVVIVTTVMGLLFLGGVPFRRFLVLFLMVLSCLLIVSYTSPYRLARLTSFLNPWADQYNTGYQLTQSLIAFGRGGFLGSGLGGSVQKLLYLPEPHTDFLFAVMAEELGLVGAIVVILFFSLLVAKIFRVGYQALLIGHRFSGYTAFGIALWLGIQSIINIGVNVGVLPTKGLTLPLMSYGSSSLIVGMIALGLVFRIDFESRLERNKNVERS